MKGVYLVGEAPAPSGEDRGLQYVLAARALGCLAELRRLGLQPWLARLAERDYPLSQLLLDIRHVNLLDHWPGRDGKGSYWPQAMAAARASELGLPGAHLVLLAGRRVARAAGLGGAPYFEPYHGAGCKLQTRCPVAVVPHPSGVNTWWNEWGNQMKAAAFLEGLVDRKKESKKSCR